MGNGVIGAKHTIDLYRDFNYIVGAIGGESGKYGGYTREMIGLAEYVEKSSSELSSVLIL